MINDFNKRKQYLFAEYLLDISRHPRSMYSEKSDVSYDMDLILGTCRSIDKSYTESEMTVEQLLEELQKFEKSSSETFLEIVVAYKEEYKKFVKKMHPEVEYVLYISRLLEDNEYLNMPKDSTDYKLANLFNNLIQQQELAIDSPPQSFISAISSLSGREGMSVNIERLFDQGVEEHQKKQIKIAEITNSIVNAINSQHKQYESKYSKSIFSPHKQRIAVMRNIEINMTDILSSDRTPEQKMVILVGMLETHKDLVKLHEKNKSGFTKMFKSKSRLVSIYDDILKGIKNVDKVNISAAVSAYKEEFPDASKAVAKLQLR